MKLNLPNKLTVFRIILIPFFVLFIVYPVFGSDNLTASRIVAAAIFIIAAITDFFDGNIARKRGLVTTFGKFMDPLADKFMIFGAFVSICFSDYVLDFGADSIIPSGILRHVVFWATLLVIFRELAITSMRLVLSNNSAIVVAANMLGKIKTVTQFVSVIIILLEPIAFPTGGILSLIFVIIMAFFTVWSGLNYLIHNWSSINTNK